MKPNKKIIGVGDDLLEPKLCFYNLVNHLSFHHGLTKCYGPPIVSMIELTNICNLRCTMCSRQYMTRKQGFMDINLFKKIINQIKQKKSLWLHNWGEPLLYPKFKEAVDYCHEKGLRTKISTTPDNLTLENIKKIENLDGMLIAFDGVKKETYEKVRIGGNFDKAMKNMHNFIRLKPKNLTVAVRIITMDETRDEIDTFVKKWTSLGLNVALKPFVVGTKLDLKNLTNKEDLLLDKQRTYENAPCKEPFTGMVVLWDGRVVPCCLDFDAKCVLGNLNKDSVKEVWNSTKMQKLRELHFKRKIKEIHLCKDCTDYWTEKQSFFYPFNKIITYLTIK